MLSLSLFLSLSLSLYNMLEMTNLDPKGIDEVWMSYKVCPWTKVEVSKCMIPLVASISLIRPHLDIPTSILTHLINHHADLDPLC